jgi:Holliday junction DNA helicase RuvB
MYTIEETARTMKNMDFRPKTFDQVVGQNDAKELLKIRIAAFKKTGGSIVHTLFLGPSGVGKTTLANVTATEMGVRFHQIMATRIRNWADFYNIIKNIEEGDVVFIDEIHALAPRIQEHLYGVMEDFTCTIEDKNLNAQVTVKIPRFTLIGATTHTGDLNAPLLSRFQSKIHLLPYSNQDLKLMIMSASERVYGVSIPANIAEKLSRLCRRTARNAYNLLRSFMDVAEARTVNKVTSSTLTLELLFEMLKLEQIDPLVGLDQASRKYLVNLIRESKILRANESMDIPNKIIPLGLDSIATLCNEQESTVKSMIEPYLLSEIEFECNDTKNGQLVKDYSPFVRITKRGRVPTSSAVNYITVCLNMQKKYGWFKNESLNIKPE